MDHLDPLRDQRPPIDWNYSTNTQYESNNTSRPTTAIGTTTTSGSRGRNTTTATNMNIMNSSSNIPTHTNNASSRELSSRRTRRPKTAGV